MFKRLFAIAAVFIFLLAAIPAYAGQLFDPQTAINNALEKSGAYYEEYNANGNPLNYVSIPILSNYLRGSFYYGCLVYGQPHGDYEDGQYRYLGYTLNGEDYTNVAFPPDVAHSGYLEDQQWIYEPWWNGDIQAYYAVSDWHNLDGTDQYALNIKHGMMMYYMDPSNANNYQIRGDGECPEFWANVHKKVHILSPPTAYSYGIGRMWRYGSSGGINYMTVPILPNVLLPELGNLKAVSIDLGIPPGQLAEPDTKYMATVVFKNEFDQKLTGVPVAVLHGEYKATLIDEKGQTLPWVSINGKEVQVADFEAGESRKFTCFWHTLNQAKDGLTGIINRDEIGKVHQETNYADNIVSAETVVEFQDLSVQILDYPQEAYVGNPVTVKAKVFNSTGKMVVTKLVWKVNGSIIKDIPNFDIISEYESAVTFNMPNSSAQVTVEVNPDHNAPPDEASWENNIDSCSIKMLAHPGYFYEGSRLKVYIKAPSSVDYWKNIDFTVELETYVPPPMPGQYPYTVPVSLDVNTSGGYITTLYNMVDGSMDNVERPISEHRSYAAPSVGWSTKTFSFTQPGLGIKGQEHHFTIEATAKMEYENARDVKKVLVAEVPLKQVTTRLTY